MELNQEEWDELVALKEAINYNPASVHYDRMERFTELLVKTLEGKAEIEPGDWLIGPGKQNEYWPISNDIFKKKYCLGF